MLDEAEEVRRSRLQRISNLGSLTRFTFDTLVAAGRDGESTWFRAAFDASREFALEPAGWLVLSGASGSGKTHLAAAIANECIGRGQPVLFMVVPDLLDQLRSSYDATVEEMGYDQMFEQVRNAPLLVLDDIDAAAGTPWAKEKLFQVVNHRYNASLATVFTCSVRPQQLDERLATRLCDESLSRVFLLEGAAHGGYQQVGGMTRERLAEMQFRDLIIPTALSAEERASLSGAFLAAKDYADEPRGWLVIQGTNGCGKTHLAAAIANKALSRGESVYFAGVPDLLDHLRSAYSPSKEITYDEVFDEIKSVDLLILDDLGAHKTSPWADEKLYQIVNYRTVSRLPTVVTTTLRPEGIREVYPNVYARILDPQTGNKIEILAPHYSLGRVPEPKAPPRYQGRGRQ